MTQNLTSRVERTVGAPIQDVWDALTDPVIIKEYMFGTEVVSDWEVGSPIVWKGEWEGKPYEDKGVILEIEPEEKISYSHFSPMSGEEDVPENYHTVTIELSEQGDDTLVALSQDNNKNEEAVEHSNKNWGMMLDGLKKVLEK